MKLVVDITENTNEVTRLVFHDCDYDLDKIWRSYWKRYMNGEFEHIEMKYDID